MDIRRIRYFLSLAETLNFSETARRFGVSQPALTKAVRKLEDDVGGALIRREGRLTHLTRFGQAMREKFAVIDHAMQNAEQVARGFAAAHMPTINVAVMCTIGPKPIEPFLRAFQQEAPEIEFVLLDASREAILPMLLEGTADCAFVGSEKAETDRIRFDPLFEEAMVVACAPGHPFAAQRTVPMAALAQEPYLDRLNCEFRDMFLHHCEEEDLMLRFVARSEREEWIQSLVRCGLGVTILPKETVLLEGLSTCLIDDGRLRRTVHLAVPRGREDTPHLRRFLAEARRFDWARKEQS